MIDDRQHRTNRRPRARSSYDEAHASSSRYASRAGQNRRGPVDFSVDRRTFTAIFAGLSAWLGIRLFDIDVLHGKEYRETAASHRTNHITLYSKRGTIFDRNGNVLAMSQECKTLYCNPKEIEKVADAANILSATLGGLVESYVAILSKDTTFAYIQRQVDNSLADEILTSLKDAEIEGIYTLADSKRVYPYGATASQILGIVNVDGVGITGLELQYNDILQGTDGEMILETGNGGTPIAGSFASITEPKNGTDLVISLDVGIQALAEKTIAEGTKTYSSDSGSVVVTDPQTGEILAMCSTPLFDIEDTSNIEDGATSLKPVSSSFEPGSIFKLITTSIGIDDGLFDPDSTYNVPAKVVVGSDEVQDDDRRDYAMNMSVREMLRRSSNTGIALLAQDVIGADRFAAGLTRFQIGTKTGIDYPGEVQGIVKRRQDYDGASLGAMSFGQSLAMPLIQMVKAVGSIANRGSLKIPHFLISKGGETYEWQDSGTTISSSTADAITDMMRTVMQEGTGTKGQVEGYDIAGKTGTGEQVGEDGTYASGKYVASLIGYAPAADPEVLVYVGLNGTPYLAADSAAPLFSTIIAGAFSELGIQPKE